MKEKHIGSQLGKLNGRGSHTGVASVYCCLQMSWSSNVEDV